MKDLNFVYRGPNSAVTLDVAERGGTTSRRDVMLWSGRGVELPQDHPYTQQLLALKLIEPAPQASNPAPAPATASAASPAPAKKSAAAVNHPQTV